MITPQPRKTSDGEVRWRIRFRHNGGRPSRTFTTEQGALEFADLIKKFGPDQALAILDARIGAPTDMTVLELCEAHIDKLTGVQADTKQKYRSMLQDLGALAVMPASAVTDTDVGRWVETLIAQGNSQKTVMNKHGFLAAVYKRAHAKNIVPINPCVDTKIPATPSRPKVFLTHDEYAFFLKFFPPHWQPFVHTMFSTGARFSELTALDIDSLDLSIGTMSIVRAWKKGNILGAPKSANSVREIPLSEQTIKILQPLVRGRTGFVFLNQRGGPVRHATFLDNVWNPAVRLANGQPAQARKRVAVRRDKNGGEILPSETPLGKSPTPHDARHTYASWLLGAGVPINIVQRTLGHESIQTTVDVYGHIMPQARAAVTGAITDAMG